MENTRVYQICRVNASAQDWRKGIPEAAIDLFPWGGLDGHDYRPLSSARVATDGNSLFIYMETNETGIRAETKGFGFVHTDSCMEFFLMPDPQTPQYLNWEFNPAGAMYLAIGTGRHSREPLARENYRELFQVKTAIHSAGWNLEFMIPLTFLRRFFPSVSLEAGGVMRGNFYKCGDHTPRPHYGCWSPINLPQPDFHCPAFFGELRV